LHIPPPEYVELYNEFPVYGLRNDTCGCPKVNSGFIRSLMSRKVNAVFVGHAHNNCYGGDYYGIDLVFGRKTGYGSYGPDTFSRGGRVINVTESLSNDGKIHVEYSHYVVEENGAIVPNGPSYKRTDVMPPCFNNADCLNPDK